MTLGIGLAITMAIGAAIGIVKPQQAMALTGGWYNPCPSWCVCTVINQSSLSFFTNTISTEPTNQETKIKIKLDWSTTCTYHFRHDALILKLTSVLQLMKNDTEHANREHSMKLEDITSEFEEKVRGLVAHEP